jgi:hypothetical protein
MLCGTSISLSSSPWRLRPLLRPRHYNAPPGGQAPSGGHAPRPPLTGAPARPQPAVPAAPRSNSTPMAVITPARAAARVAAPPEAPPGWGGG